MTTATHKTRLADHTSGVRLRVDQIEAVAKLCDIDPEMDMSTAVRRGLDMFLSTQADLLTQASARHFQASSPGRAFTSISTALARGSMQEPEVTPDRKRKRH